MAMSATLVLGCLFFLATRSSGLAAAAAAKRKQIETAFTVSSGMPEIFLGEDTNNPAAQSALRAKLDMILDTVEAHYTGLLHRAHELNEPRVASLLKDLLLMGRPQFGRRLHLEDGADGGGEAGVASAASATTSASAATNGSVSLRAKRIQNDIPYIPPDPLPMRLSAAISPYQLSDWALKVGSRLAQLPPVQAYPVLRRLLAAAAVRAWLDGAGKRLSEKDDEAITGLFIQLYMLHRRGAIVKGIMDYQHVSKSGGTSWCHAAELNGCTTQRFDKYHVCGISRFEDKVRWMDGEAHKRLTGGDPSRWALHGTFRTEEAPGCTIRAAQMRTHHWTYYSNEYTLTGGHKSMADVEVCSKQFVTSILFRNPLKRLSSHVRFILLHYKRFMEEQQQAGGTADYFKTYANANASFWQSVAPAIVDNCFARTLLGEAVWHAPVGSMTMDHLKAARLVLMQFDLVVPLEAPADITSRLMAFGAGWPVSYTDVHDKNISALQEYFNFDPTPYMPSDEALAFLYQQQTVDVPLYELAVLIGKLDYLVYSTAAAAGIVPWDGMPQPHSVAPEDEATSVRVACGLLRGPGGVWSVNMLRRKRRMKAYRGIRREVEEEEAEKAMG